MLLLEIVPLNSTVQLSVYELNISGRLLWGTFRAYFFHAWTVGTWIQSANGQFR